MGGRLAGRGIYPQRVEADGQWWVRLEMPIRRDPRHRVKMTALAPRTFMRHPGGPLRSRGAGKTRRAGRPHRFARASLLETAHAARGAHRDRAHAPDPGTSFGGGLSGYGRPFVWSGGFAGGMGCAQWRRAPACARFGSGGGGGCRDERLGLANGGNWGAGKTEWRARGFERGRGGVAQAGALRHRSATLYFARPADSIGASLDPRAAFDRGPAAARFRERAALAGSLKRPHRWEYNEARGAVCRTAGVNRLYLFRP